MTWIYTYIFFKPKSLIAKIGSKNSQIDILCHFRSQQSTIYARNIQVYHNIIPKKKKNRFELFIMHCMGKAYKVLNGMPFKPFLLKVCHNIISKKWRKASNFHARVLNFSALCVVTDDITVWIIPWRVARGQGLLYRRSHSQQ